MADQAYVPLQDDDNQDSSEIEPSGSADYVVGSKVSTDSELNDMHAPTPAAEPARRIIIVTIAMFMGYAILISFQHKVKCKYGIKDANDARSHLFGVAVSFLYIGNLIFRLAHNFVFACILPRNRVFVALGAMGTSICILGFFIFTFNWTGSLAWVFLAYMLGGVGIGSFESNLLSAITPLGHETKMWAILGFPIGFACVLVGGFALTAAGTPDVAIYMIVLAMLVCGGLVFQYSIPNIPIENNSDSFSAFVDNFRHWREWLPPIAWHCLALMINMFAVSLFSGVLLYILNGTQVPLFGVHSTTHIPHDGFFVIYNLFTLMGDSSSRRVAYRFKPRHPMIFLVLSVMGAVLCLCKVAILAPLGIFMIFFANGSIYATTTRHIDTFILKEFNLIALSFWLFVGDFGSVAGSNIISYASDWVCTSHTEYICTSVTHNCN